MTDDAPSMVFADQDGNIMDFPPLAMVGRSGDYLTPLNREEVIALPPGAQLYVLPQRHPLGMDRESGEVVVMERNPFDERQAAYAVATFLPAAHTQTYLAAWERCPDSPVLPLYAYTALGWSEGFVTTALRTDPSRRQDPDTFDMQSVQAGIQRWRGLFPDNRLVEHLCHCALGYGCPAALNLFQGREEAPLPTSPACNARCLGCISLQDCQGPPSPQQRITFVPTPDEIAQIALKHIAEVERAVVSFGQGCEGEPLLVSDVIREAIRLIRRQTSRGTINLNSNASLPERIAELADAGLDSLRISTNSLRRATYEAYFRPTYDFADVLQSARIMKTRGKFVSLNLFVFPGVTDAPKEAQALKDFVAETGVDLIQWRNLNIDPDSYLETLNQRLPFGMGMQRLIREIPARCGYFNPSLEQA